MAGSAILAGPAHALGGGVGGVTQPVTTATSAVASTTTTVTSTTTTATTTVQSAPQSSSTAVQAPVQTVQQAAPAPVQQTAAPVVQSTQQTAAPVVQSAQQTVAPAAQIVTATATTVTQSEPAQAVTQTVERTVAGATQTLAGATQDVGKTATAITSGEPVGSVTSLVTGAGEQLASGTPAQGVVGIVAEIGKATTGGGFDGRAPAASLLTGGARIGAVPVAGSDIGPAATLVGLVHDGVVVGSPSSLSFFAAAAVAGMRTPSSLPGERTQAALASAQERLAQTLRDLAAGGYAGLARAVRHASAPAAAPFSRDYDAPLPGQTPGGFLSSAAGAAALLAFAVLVLALLPFMLVGPRAGPWLRPRAERIPLAAHFATLERPG